MVRERFFTPRLRFKSYDEMNAWLIGQCVPDAKVHRHPEIADKTIWDVFEEERQKLVPYRGRLKAVRTIDALWKAAEIRAKAAHWLALVLWNMKFEFARNG